MIIVSACLAGIVCRYDGKAVLHELAAGLVEKGLAVPVCPEVLGGLSTPRVPAERVGLKVYQRDGTDVTEAYELGVSRALEIVHDLMKDEPVTCAILQSRSPSCGYGTIYDGTFCGRLIPGNGLFAEYIEAMGIPIITDADADEAAVQQYHEKKQL